MSKYSGIYCDICGARASDNFNDNDWITAIGIETEWGLFRTKQEKVDICPDCRKEIRRLVNETRGKQ